MATKVIVVDDAAFIREVLGYILQDAGYEIVGEAADGDEAIEIVKKTEADLVLMDIVMPRKSGVQATKEILEDMPNLPIVAISTEDSETMVMKALEAGCCDYVVKPFKKDELIRVLNKVTAREKSGGANA